MIKDTEVSIEIKRHKLIFSNVKLLLNNIDFIKNEPNYCNLLAYTHLYVAMYTGPGGKISLGNILETWKNKPDYSVDCDCGGVAYIHFFGCSPLSGTIFHWQARCGDCGKHIEYFKNHQNNYHDQKQKRNLLGCMPHSAKNTDDNIDLLNELIDKLKNLEAIA